MRDKYQGSYPREDDDIGLNFNDEDTFLGNEVGKIFFKAENNMEGEKVEAPLGNCNSWT